jgi:hypothetical protein
VGNCSEAPVYAQLGFSKSKSDNLILVSKNNDVYINGYNANASLYETEICMNDKCKITQVFAAISVFEDHFLWDYSGAYGSVGLGLRSPIWAGFTDP